MKLEALLSVGLLALTQAPAAWACGGSGCGGGMRLGGLEFAKKQVELSMESAPANREAVEKIGHLPFTVALMPYANEKFSKGAKGTIGSMLADRAEYWGDIEKILSKESARIEEELKKLQESDHGSEGNFRRAMAVLELMMEQAELRGYLEAARLITRSIAQDQARWAKTSAETVAQFKERKLELFKKLGSYKRAAADQGK